MRKNFNSRKPLVLFSLSIGMVLLFFAVEYIYKNPVNIEKRIAEIKQSDQKTRHELILVSQKMDSLLSQKINSNRFWNNISKSLGNDNQFSIFITHRNRPVFWKNLNIPVDKIRELQISKQPQLVKLENGFYYYQKIRQHSGMAFIAIKIKNAYNYNNNYLDNNFLGHYAQKGATDISFKQKQPNYFLVKTDGKTEYFIKFGSPDVTGNFNYSFLLMLCYILAILFFSSFLRSIYLHANKRWQLPSGFMLILFSADVILIRALLFYFRFPAAMYDSLIFDPRFFASSNILPSLGDLFINTSLVLYLAYTFKRFYHFKTDISKKSALRKNFAVFTLYLHIFIFLGLISLQLENIILNSVLPLNLNNLYNINGFTFLGYALFSFQILAYFFVCDKLIEISKKYGFKKGASFKILIASTAFYFLFKFFLDKDPYYWLVMATVLLYLGGNIFLTQPKITLFYRQLLLVILLSVFFTVIFNWQNGKKEKQERMFIADQILMSNSDPAAEYLFTQIKSDILQDSTIKKSTEKYAQGITIREDSIVEYIHKKYFQGFWKKFNLQITLCKANDQLTIESIDKNVNCFAFFGHLKNEYGDPSSFTDQLYQIEYANGDNGYLGIIRFDHPESTALPVHYYIEMLPVREIKELGYPELLIDSEIDQLKVPYYYSWAIYKNGKLVYRNGNYGFRDELPAGETKPESISGQADGYYYQISSLGKKTIKIVHEKPSLQELITPFPYIFLSVLIMLYLLSIKIKVPQNRISASLLQKLQLVLLGLFIVAFFLIAQNVLSLLIKLDNEKNIENLNEKTHSILIEMQHKLSDTRNIRDIDRQWLGNLLTKFSNVFFTDINVFDKKGFLIASSRAEVFEQGLKSDLMSYTAYKALKHEKKSFYLQKEKIGTQEYYSSYIPFVNKNHETIAYLNLPYFARQTDLQKEVSSVVATFINLYVFVTILVILSIILLSKLITRPVQLLVDKIKTIKLGHKNEKIDWKSADEFSYLIDEYNRMIDELELSAEKLAASERESAWRDVARQIAHEIKNPLTPMKLSVQHLIKAWNDKDPEFEARLMRFRKTMVDEIDTLSEIASDFSNFAKLSKPEIQAVNIVEIARNVRSLFGSERIKISILPEGLSSMIIMADKRLLNQVFNNLIKNAVQAIPLKIQGIITITFEVHGDYLQTSISDNGLGIDEEVQAHIFEPRFTTKSSGMGLGLAMVKTIIEEHQGKIHMISQQGRGTTFYFDLPLQHNLEKEI